MQALGGLVEAGIGGSASLYSGGSVAIIGIPVMVHGFDQFIAGMNTAITGEYRDTVTSQLLQTTQSRGRQVNRAKGIMPLK